MTMGGRQVPHLAAKFAEQHVLVTGAFGFIGGHITKALVAGGAKVTALDTDASAQRPSLINLVPGLRDAIAIQAGSVTDAELVRGIFARTRFNHVFHFAAFASAIEPAAARPVDTMVVNATGIVHLLAAAVETQQHLSSFVHTSTDKVYGDHHGEPYRETAEVYRCDGVYETSKLAADLFARSYRRNFGVPTIVVRMCNVFGPGDIDGVRSRLVPRAMAALYRDDRAPIIYEGNAQNRRDYLYVDDCCRALLGLATSNLSHLPPDAPGVFNVPGVENLTTIEMCQAVTEAVAELAERDGEPQFARRVRARSCRVQQSARPSLPVIPVQRSTGARVAAHTGFRPEVSVRNGLLRTAEFYRGHWAGSAKRHEGEAQSG